MKIKLIEVNHLFALALAFSLLRLERMKMIADSEIPKSAWIWEESLEESDCSHLAKLSAKSFLYPSSSQQIPI